MGPKLRGRIFDGIFEPSERIELEGERDSDVERGRAVDLFRRDHWHDLLADEKPPRGNA